MAKARSLRYEEHRTHYLKDKDKYLARARVRNKTHPATPDDYRRWRYGITAEQFMQLIARQGGKCAICPTDITGPKAAHVDHCHATKKVRGILCLECNTGLGKFKDSIELLAKAIEYLSHGGANGS
jgi:hypothetical protein